MKIQFTCPDNTRHLKPYLLRIVEVNLSVVVESSWNVMAHGDALEGKWRGNWRMEWVASTLHNTSEHVVSSITTADAHTSAANSRLNWRPADLNGPVRFAERRNLVSARVSSRFKSSVTLHAINTVRWPAQLPGIQEQWRSQRFWASGMSYHKDRP
jgi:hypothetical protein